ncbi:flavin-containing monooxygenase 5-like [Uloborus diversus]|uniref:flavin-containing monooxygenase 5-like n=1 Tax=Uloborus diversus TaxID=327109 RepID=UPI00240A077B|nr:flavin-containing monooxygenase 5-like [Uloborus diversus]
MTRKRIAVIGAGPCGLTTVKCLLEENLIPTCFEQTEHIGGLWRYHEDDIDGLASVMKTTIINSSKEITAMSDFPPSADASNYMHNKQVYEYLKSYSKAFDLEKYVVFNKEVIEVDVAESYDVTGRLNVVTKDTKTNRISQEEFDGVMVCIGHHVYPNMPTFSGMDKFRGTIMHTHSLKKVDELAEKRVVVVGVGNSGMDAAVDISTVAKQVYLSTRRGAWVLPRVGPGGMPFDLVMLRRWLNVLLKSLPYFLVCWFTEKMLNYNFDHYLYNLKPQHRVWSQHPTISDTLPIRLLSGTVVVKKNIETFTENGVIFEDEMNVTECDTIVFATGYKINFPFLSNKIAAVKGNEVHLYKYVFPPHMKHPSLAILGLVQIVGGGFPVGEIQGRWATLVMNRKLALPSREKMEADIQQRKDINSKRYVKSERHTIQADYIEYMDEIASLIHAKPNLLKIFFLDFPLFANLLFGPSLPYQYRLQGPHPWDGARTAILEWKTRVVKPLKQDYEEHSFVKFYIIASICVFIALVFMLKVLL